MGGPAARPLAARPAGPALAGTPELRLRAKRAPSRQTPARTAALPKAPVLTNAQFAGGGLLTDGTFSNPLVLSRHLSCVPSLSKGLSKDVPLVVSATERCSHPPETVAFVARFFIATQGCYNTFVFDQS